MTNSFYKNKVILITGGTGSFGSGFIRYLLKNANPKKIIVFSRDEFKQFYLQKEFEAHGEKLRFFLGDIRDLRRLERAMNGVDLVVHAAALKQVPALEYNPSEAIQTNILGTQNVIDAAISRNIKHVLLISTDKAAEPINLYGATKMCAEKLFIASNVYTAGSTKFGAVRYGNVIGSRGSIVETILKSKEGPVHITHEQMTRFWLTLDSTFKLVTFALQSMVGGEMFIPKASSMSVVDMFEAIAPGRERKIMGLRPGEKIHEVLLTEDEAMRSLDLGDYFVVLPHSNSTLSAERYEKYRKSGKKLSPGFKFQSDSNDKWITKQEFSALLKK
ncbi:MAG: UDP-N-acetylglucosamine 4,6-dehydratase (inverting) [Candidatus Vogelbacteria bacterium]|nr:UDP-N-acetylglucosamine 4,6-dehydratase (inverting) [Candidatus Vogelbacteria bacterium]